MSPRERTAWLVAAGLTVLTAVYFLSPREVCPYMATDFRGYYASAQIALERGFAAVYDLSTQQAYQDRMPLHCPQGSVDPLLYVYMPYLPVFILLFIPFVGVGFSLGYWLWSGFNLLALAGYSLLFAYRLGVRRKPGQMLLDLLPWMISLPMLANLSLGQINLFLVVCLGEFLLAASRGRSLRSGLWLAGMLMKPHTLILLLAGLALARRWRVLAGFTLGALVLLGSSFLVGGPAALFGSLKLMVGFAGPLIQSGASMMNWRAVALNLLWLPSWLAWGLAGCGMAATLLLVLRLWQQPFPAEAGGWALRLLATSAGTFIISWHSHFYLDLLLIPLLFSLDQLRRLPGWLRMAWWAAPPVLYGLVSLLKPDLARSVPGLVLLGYNLAVLAWAVRQGNER